MSCIDAPRLENALGEEAGPALWVSLDNYLFRRRLQPKNKNTIPLFVNFCPINAQKMAYHYVNMQSPTGKQAREETEKGKEDTRKEGRGRKKKRKKEKETRKRKRKSKAASTACLSP